MTHQLSPVDSKACPAFVRALVGAAGALLWRWERLPIAALTQCSEMFSGQGGAYSFFLSFHPTRKILPVSSEWSQLSLGTPGPGPTLDECGLRSHHLVYLWSWVWWSVCSSDSCKPEFLGAFQGVHLVFRPDFREQNLNSSHKGERPMSQQCPRRVAETVDISKSVSVLPCSQRHCPNSAHPRKKTPLRVLSQRTHRPQLLTPQSSGWVFGCGMHYIIFVAGRFPFLITLSKWLFLCPSTAHSS